MKTAYYLPACLAICFPLACATTSTPTTQSERVVAISDAGSLRTPDEAPVAAAVLAGKPDKVFSALRETYEELGIKVNILEPAGANGGHLGNRYFIKNSRLGKVPLSQYLDCGNTMTGPAADNYKITMSVQSVVSAAPDGSSVNTRVAARADPPAAGGGSLACRSIGTLEAEIHRMLRTRLGLAE